MRQRLLLIFLLVLNFSSFGQTYGNEWINYNQKYFSFPIVQSGIYKIEYSTLESLGIPLASISTQNFQIFGRQREVALYMQDGGDNQFNNGDYFLFYAQRNDCWLDSTLFDNAAWIGNPYYSMYNDTINYFFTWNNQINNKRVTIETDLNINGFTASNYVITDKFDYFFEKYNEGEKNSEAASSFFVKGEGWGKNAINGASTNGNSWNFSTVQFENIYQGSDAPNVIYKSVIVGQSNATPPSNNLPNHHSRHTIGTNNIAFVDTTFTGFKSMFINKSIPVSLFPASGNSNYRVRIIGDLGVATDFQSINYYSFLYPRTTSFNNTNKTSFFVNNNPVQSKIRLNISNVNMPSPVMMVMGQNAVRWIPLTGQGSSFSALVPNDASNNQLVVLQDASTIINLTNLLPVNQTGDFTNFAAISNKEKALLFIYPTKLKNKSLEYAAYRSSTAGGSHNVIPVNIEELYLQYGGGIPKHISATRRFAQQMYNLTTQKPVGMFLIGKGIREANVTSATNLGPGSRTNSEVYQNNLIPSFGQPSCDACISSNLPGTNKWSPLIPTSRISVQTEEELQIYFSKVVQFEQQQNQSSAYSTATKDWQKHILHFSGGTDATEQEIFQTYLNNMGNIAKDREFAGTVQLVAKSSSAPITPTELQAIKDRIKDGVTLMNFFGHFTTSESGFDVNLDEPANWDNQGKYPLLLANSCYNGNIFHNAESNSQNFVLAPNAGVIGYIGTIDYGFTSALNSYSRAFYRQFARYNYGGTIASHIKYVLDSSYSANASLITEATFCQMTYNGDPMLRLNYHNKPEVEITDSRVSFGPNLVTYATDSISVSITMRNLGKAINDPFTVEVRRDFPGSNSDSLYFATVSGLNYEKTIQIKMPFLPTIGVGLNKFTISVDIPSYITEQYDETNNNRIFKNFLIDIDGIQPVLPENFAVVPRDTISLYASTINPLSSIQTYRFEIDTVPTFNSNFKRYAEKVGSGGVKSVNWNEWKSVNTNNLQPLNFTDSSVYYWRVALVENNPVWKTRSFQYIKGKSGWGQADFQQFVDNSFTGINLNTLNQLREFTPNSSDISCRVLAAIPGANMYNNAWYLNGVQQDYNICTITPKLQVAIIDKSSLTAWETRFTYPNGTVANPNNNFGNANDNGGCEQRPMKFFTFNQNSSTQLAAFRNLVENIVPFGDYILVYTPITTRYDWWNTFDPALYQTFANLGSDSIVPGRANRPFAFLTRKGDPNFVVEVFSQNNEEIILESTLTGVQSTGREASPIIGPVSKWESLFWKHRSLESNSSDQTDLEIQVLNAYGAYQFSINPELPSGDSLYNLSSQIDANLYPNIRLISKYSDVQTQTPAQLDYWQVLYEGLPEAAIDATNGYTFLPNDSIQEGNVAKFSVNIRNISDIDMDSLLVNYYIVDANQTKRILPYSRQDSLRVAGSLKDTISFSTLGLKGLNWFHMEVNPYIDANSTLTDQPELTHLNNVLQFPFNVFGENKNPLLDVTFNGRHIMNKDIIAPTSEIVISLKDENPYLIMDSDADTARFGVYLTDPSGVQRRVYFMNSNGTPNMTWIPATAQNKKFKIIFSKNFDVSGIYNLTVQGTDRSGNLSGDLEYNINFEVILESSITQMMNYPNPFSTSTRFVFTLTGDQVPDDIQIQIMTISGKVVREINEAELGPIQIGRNITQFVWDGKDNFGDPLANGVYLYRVKAKINGQDIKMLNSGADAYFHKGMGKMYILR